MNNDIPYTRLVFLFLAGIFLHACSDPEDPGTEITTPGNALAHYLDNGDTTYLWELQNSYDILDVKAYDLLLTSQQWHEYTWKHQLTVLVPPDVRYDGALLWITGGSLKDGLPNWTSQNDGEIWTFGMAALGNHAIVAVLKQTPNQPLFDNLSEDALISFTLHNFQSDGDYSWPLLFPMVKSAVRAMDAVQEFAEETADHEITGFLVSGASKRGWTTWLTGASDPRVKAIAPAVIDVLNMPVNLDYQLEVWGDYSTEIQDYVDLGIPQAVNTEQGNALATMIDPYSYRDHLDMPKLILIGTNDPYWPVDAVKHYFDGLSGENFIQYTPNAGHDLNGGQRAKWSMNAFFCNTFAPLPYAGCSWETTETGTGVTLQVEGSENAVRAAYLWTADSGDRDFRDEVWSSSDLDAPDNTSVSATVEFPESGFRAFYIDLEYKDLNGRSYTISTRVFVTDDDELL